jgi:hypothetical protein
MKNGGPFGPPVHFFDRIHPPMMRMKDLFVHSIFDEVFDDGGVSES